MTTLAQQITEFRNILEHGGGLPRHQSNHGRKTGMTQLSEKLKTVFADISALLAAKEEKDANGESERYHELKRNAWGNARDALSLLPAIIEGVRGLEEDAVSVEQIASLAKLVRRVGGYSGEPVQPVPQVSAEVVAQAVYSALDRKSCPGPYLQIAYEAALAAIQHPEGGVGE